jgi:hypothetical protein
MTTMTTMTEAPLSSSRYYTGINTESEVDKESRNRFVNRYNDLDVSNMNGVGVVSGPKSDRSGKFRVPEINIISNDWDRYLFAIKILNCIETKIGKIKFIMLRKRSK